MPVLELDIPVQKKSYEILIKQGLIDNLKDCFEFANYSKIVIITDDKVGKFWLQKVLYEVQKANKNTFVIKIKNGEKNKNLNTIEDIYRKLLQFKTDRKSLLLALGGGVIGDLVGFVACTWMRGIDFLQIPTTLLAQVDSSVGGKTGFDFDSQKNLIGAFKQPKKVLIDPVFLTTLPDREYIQGLAEVLKYGLIQDQEFWKWLKEKHKILVDLQHPEFNSTIIQAILKSCQIKAQIVTKDELETLGLRQLLNLGHTFGHSLESFSLTTKNPLFHGEAVAIGINFISQISDLTKSEKTEIKEVLESFKLPTSYRLEKSFDKNEIQKRLYEMMLADKKNLDEKIKWVVLQKIGVAKSNIEIDEKKVRQAILQILTLS
jgi:3-dehydroquinate synthase